MTTTAELVRDATEAIPSLDAQGLLLVICDGATVLDVRERDEVMDLGGLHGAVHVPRGLLEFRADPTGPGHDPRLDPHRPVVTVCTNGRRAALAAAVLQQLGYRDVRWLEGGTAAWQRAGLAVVLPSEPPRP